MESGQDSIRGRDRVASPTCPQCDGGVETILHQHTFRYGSGKSAADIEVMLPVRRCAPCDFEFIDEEGHRLKHEALCRHLGVLTPREIRRIRERHGLSRAAFARVTKLGEASLARWETGIVLQTQANDSYLRLLDRSDAIAKLAEGSGIRADEDAVPTTRRQHAAGGRYRVLVVTEEVREMARMFELRKESRRRVA